MLDPEITGGVAGRSTTNFTDHSQVNDQNNHRHDHVKRDHVNVSDDNDVILIPTDVVDSLGDQRDQCHTDDDFLRSGCRTQLHCLFIFSVLLELRCYVFK